MQPTHKRVSITRSADETYALLSVPENFARCLWGRRGALRPAGADWTVDTAEGRLKLRLSERNSFGVLDYSLMQASGTTLYVPLRVVANDEGCELVMTLFHHTVGRMRDLLAAKRLVEKLS